MAVKKSARAPKKRSRVDVIVKASVQPPVNRMKKRKALVIAQEIKFARLLANNDKRVRDKMLKNLKKWLTVRSESSFAFTESDFMRLWKGLFYCMWMSDKPLIQEELAESLSNIVHCFDSMETALLYTKCTLKTLATEWFGIDQYRLDKFQMLVRRIVRQMFEMCRRRSWDAEWTKGAARAVECILSDPKTTLGFNLHITELYMEEMAKIGGRSIPPHLVTELVRPFAVHLATIGDERQINHVVKHIFRYLMFQSDVGMDYMEKFEAWRRAGFPCGNIDAMEKVELSDDESDGEDEDEDDESDEVENESNGPGPLDPRAGRVDVELPQLPFDPLEIAKLIKQYKFHPKSTAKTRKQIVRLIAEFSEIAQGSMPLGIKEVEVPRRKSSETNPKKAAYRLLEFEKDLYSDTIHRKRKKKRAEAFVEDDEGFENVLIPIDDEENAINGYHHDERDDSDSRPDSDDDAMEETNEGRAFEARHVSRRTDKKKTKKNSMNGNPLESLEKTTSKISKKRKFGEKSIVGDEDCSKKPEKSSISVKDVKHKIKKSKTKKILNAINSFNQKLMNRLSDEVPVKAKKSRLSNEGTWDVSSTDDAAPIVAVPTKSEATEVSNAKVTEPKETSLSSDKLACGRSDKDLLRQIPWLLPVLTKLEDEKLPQTPTRTPPEVQGGSSAKKRVKIMLRKNTAQHTSEYMLQLRKNPAIPYDASRKPPAGVLKPSPLPSPANPFYKRL